jgi:hypothetical protein
MKRLPAIWLILALTLFAGTAGAEPGDMDTLSAQSAESLDSLQASLSRNSLGRVLADYIFISRTGDPSGESIESESPYVSHVGRFIRNIEIYRYNILSDTPVGSKNPDLPALVRGIERIHMDTKISKITAFLLFEEGDPVDPYALADSERLLRETPFIQDARVIVIPVEESPDSVDVQVLTRDFWSIGIRYTWITEDRHRIKLFERNLLGYGQTIEWEVSVDLEREESRKTDHALYYGAPNIFSTFIDGSIRWIDAVAYKYNEWALSRRYISPEIKWIGGAAIEGMDDVDDVPSKVRKWDRQDLWIGRSFRLGRGHAGEDSRRRIIPAVRVTRTDYHVRPDVSADKNRGYHDRTSYLGSVSLTERSFRKMRMVFSFGRTEDVAYGFLASVTGGSSVGEFHTRPYLSADLAYSLFVGNSGYLAARAAAGGYHRDGAMEDGTFSLTLGGFSSLLPFWRSVARHFFVIDYINGYNRLPNDTVELEEPRGDLRGMSNTGIEGHQRLTISWEGILFADWDWWGFRFASFGYAETGQCGPDWDSFLSEKYYFSLGGGFRIHNERLAFDVYELRFMFHPVVPEGADTQLFRFEAVRNLRIPFLSPGAPRVLKYE